MTKASNCGKIFIFFSIKVSIVLLCLVLFHNELHAQNNYFIIKDKQHQIALPAVNFTFYRDTVSKITALSDEKGTVAIDIAHSGRYRIAVSCMGYLPLDTAFFVKLGEVTTIYLNEENIQLQAVNIQARKKFIEVKKGNFIMNIQEHALAKTSNTWDALKYGPLVETRMDGTLKVANKDATVFVDGRQVLMRGDDLMKYLAGIPAANIEKIEISSHPGAKYDSSIGSVILITTKNILYEGLKGTLNLSGTKGVFERYDSGASLDGKIGKVSIQTGYNYGHSIFKNQNQIYTSINSRNLPWEIEQVSINKRVSHRAFGNVGLAFNKNNQLTIYGEYTPNKNRNTVNGNNDEFTAERIKSQDSIWQTSNIINAQSSSIATQAVYESKWDSSGQSLKMIVAYSKSRSNSLIRNDVSYYDDANLIQKEPFYRASLFGETIFNTFSGQYVRPLFGGEWISGLRFYNTKLQNNNAGYSYSNIDRTIGETLNNLIDFEYSENNYGLFTSWEAQVKSWYFQLGLRVEQNTVYSQSNTLGREKVYEKVTPFPTIYIQKKINEKNLFAFDYSKQISRPDYSLLNPFARFTNNTVADFIGNSKIRPSRTHGFNLSWTYNNKLVISLGSVILKDLISSILLRNEKGLLIQQYDNFNGFYHYLGAYYTFPPMKFWQVSINGRLSTIKLEQYGNLPLGKANINVYGNVSNDFTLGNHWKIGIGMDFTNRSSDQFYDHKGYKNVTASVIKTFNKPQLDLFLRGADIFKTTYSGTTSLFLPYRNFSYNDTQTFTFGLTYRFGKQTVKVKGIDKDNNLKESNKRMGDN
jgi:ferric enterobactin receptor